MSSCPPDKIILTASKIACKQIDNEYRALCFDYYEDSRNGTVFIGVRPDGTKLLIKNKDEYTSNIVKVYKVSDERGVDHFIFATENSVYVTVSTIKTMKASQDYD
jgi:hypothetical protein